MFIEPNQQLVILETDEEFDIAENHFGYIVETDSAGRKFINCKPDAAQITKEIIQAEIDKRRFKKRQP